MKKKILVVSLLITFLATSYYFINKIGKKNNVKNKNEMVVENKKEKQENFEMQQEIRNEKKKYQGKIGDKELAEIIELNQIGEIIDYKENKFPKLQLKIKDISGIYRVRILFFYNKKNIGYYQKNPNTNQENVKVSFDIDENIILDDFKTFLDYEGAKIKYKISIWDNNMNQKSVNGKKEIEIIDRTKPEEVKVYWKYYFAEKYDEIIYSKEEKNEFTIYKTGDLPKLVENKIKKYQIRIESENGELLFRAGIQPFEEQKKDISLDIPNDGNYKLFLRGYDLRENFIEKEIKFGIDRTKPIGKLYLVNGITYNPNENIKIEILSKDNLSGVFRYRIAETKEKLLASQWKDIENFTNFKAKADEGIFDIFCQIQDNAFNNSEIFQTPYYVNKNKNLMIKSQSGDRERILELKKPTKRNEKIKILKVEEK